MENKYRIDGEIAIIEAKDSKGNIHEIKIDSYKIDEVTGIFERIYIDESGHAVGKLKKGVTA